MFMCVCVHVRMGAFVRVCFSSIINAATYIVTFEKGCEGRKFSDLSPYLIIIVFAVFDLYNL